MAIEKISGYTQACREDINRRLDEIDVKPNEELGQHFLVNQGAIDVLVQAVTPGATVIEVGCGPGHITEQLAEKAGKLHGIEIDRRYHPLLDKIVRDHNNVNILYGDALKVNFGRLLPKSEDVEGQVVANLPYNITEPFIQKIAPERLASITLVVGKRYADSISATASSDSFGRLSILTSTFFDVATLATIQRDSCYPTPRTESAIVQLRPRDPREVSSSRRDAVLRHLFLTSKQNSSLRKGLKEGFDVFEQSKDGAGLSKGERNHRSRSKTKLHLKDVLDQIRGESVHQDEDSLAARTGISRRSRSAIEQLGIVDLTLDKPFALLNNSELRLLYTVLS